jgi:hypothetical protein
MTITALPTAPSINDPANFATRADAWIAALATFVTEANALAVAMNLNATTDTSASSVLIGLGAKSFAVTAGKSFQPGMWLVIADTAAATTNSMYGQVTSYSGTALVMNITAVYGSGTKSAWSISQASGGAALGSGGLISGAAIGLPVALTSSAASIAVDLALANNFTHTTSENTTLAAPSNPVAGQSGVIVITQGSSPGSPTVPWTLAYNSFWKFAGGSVPALTAREGAKDVLSYYIDSTGSAICQLTKDIL